MTESYRNYIGGEWVDSLGGDTFENRNPADSGDLIGTFQQSNEEDADRAVDAAADAQEAWADTPGPERGRILKTVADRLGERSDEIARALAREEGKTLSEATGEVNRAIDTFSYYGEKARDLGGELLSPSNRDQKLYTVADPVGVASLITPWNYPIAIPTWKLAPALAAGNAVVLKPASVAPNTPRLLFECLDEAGVPDGVANYVTGPGSDVGSRLAAHDLVDAVSFTGSTFVGNAIADQANEGLKRVQLEMGGKNPALVMPSADVERAADLIATGAFGVTGQACTATSRAIVHEYVLEEFTEHVVDQAEAITVGPGLDDTDMGPHVTKDELETTLEYVDVGENEGATLLSGGGRLTDGDRSDGHFVEPTVFGDVDPDMRIAREEIFGPILAIIPVGSFEEAVDIGNDVEYGLSASVFTGDLREAHEFVDEIEAGAVRINQSTRGGELHAPFGGVKESSSETYREQGDAGLDFFTLTRTVYMSY